MVFGVHFLSFSGCFDVFPMLQNKVERKMKGGHWLMATKEIKRMSVNNAIEITKEAVRGGYDKDPPGRELKDLYETLVDLSEKISTDD